MFTMLLILALARNNHMVISPLCWIIVGLYAWWRVVKILVEVNKEWER